jgi:hypothetical protein
MDMDSEDESEDDERIVLRDTMRNLKILCSVSGFLAMRTMTRTAVMTRKMSIMSMPTFKFLYAPRART